MTKVSLQVGFHQFGLDALNKVDITKLVVVFKALRCLLDRVGMPAYNLVLRIIPKA